MPGINKDHEEKGGQNPRDTDNYGAEGEEKPWKETEESW